MKNNELVAKFNQFKSLHHNKDTFILPNPWDVMSAKIFAMNGFAALGTTSAGISASLGYQDGEEIAFDKVLEVTEKIVNAVNIPVSADIENGYSSHSNIIVEHAKSILSTGIVGINIEDGSATSKNTLDDPQVHVEKIKIFKEIAQSINQPLFINARIDTYWLNIGNDNDRLEETLKRADLYKKAGADCLFVPGLSDEKILSKISQATNHPLNVLVGKDTPPLSTLSKIGVKRLSTGSGPFRAYVQLIDNIAHELANNQTYELLQSGTKPYGEVQEYFKQ